MKKFVDRNISTSGLSHSKVQLKQFIDSKFIIILGHTKIRTQYLFYGSCPSELPIGQLP